MAAMSTTLTEFQDSGDSRTYKRAGHTPSLPRLLLQRRKVPSGNAGSIAEDQISVLSGTVNVDGDPIPGRVMFTVTVRRPVDGSAADVTAALAVFRDVVAGDEFGATVSDQGWLV